MKDHTVNGRPRIMIVEDERIVALDLRQSLQRRGYNVCASVPSGEQALAVLPEAKPDFVLMDIMLEGTLDGIETTRKIRELARVPIVFLSAYTDEDTQKRAWQTNPEAFLAKPVEIAVLDSTIQMTLERTNH